MKNFVDTHPIGRVFDLGNEKAVWKRVTELKAGMKIAVANSSGYSHERPEGVEWDEIVEIKSVGRERVYDIEVEGTHNFVGNGILAHNTYIALTDTGDLNIEKIAGTDQYAVRNTQDNNFISRIGAFAEVVAANIKAGAVETKDLVTQSLTAFQGTIDNLLINNGLVSPVIQTDLISPLADSSDVVIKLGKTATSGEPKLTPEESYGKLAIQNAEGEEVASIDSSGSAEFKSASVSGELYAESIVSPDLDKIQELLRQVKEDQDLLAQASAWNINTASESATANMENLYVTNQAAINSLSISNSLSVGTDLVFQSSSIQYPVSSINTLQAPLAIQSLAMAPVEIMAGKIRIETNGDVTINANLFVAGKIESESIKTKEITIEKLVIATSPTSAFAEASADKPEVSSTSGTIKSNAVAGSAVIPAGLAELEIENSKIDDYSLIYVTPTSSTENNVLFVKSKEAHSTSSGQVGKFVVGFNQALDVDVTFNWWVIEVQQ